MKPLGGYLLYATQYLASRSLEAGFLFVRGRLLLTKKVFSWERGHRTKRNFTYVKPFLVLDIIYRISECKYQDSERFLVGAILSQQFWGSLNLARCHYTFMPASVSTKYGIQKQTKLLTPESPIK
jgi:hypothetical protein